MADTLEHQYSDTEASSDEDETSDLDKSSKSSDGNTTDTEVYDCPDEKSIDITEFKVENLVITPIIKQEHDDSDTDDYEYDDENSKKETKELKKTPVPYFPKKREKCIPHQCKTCKEVFQNRKECNAHMKEKGHFLQYTCEYCGKSYKMEAYLKFHQSSHTGEGLNFNCKLCDKRFATRGNLETHMRWHMVRVRNETNAITRPFVCEYCGANFRHTTDLKRHIRLHSGVRPHVCTICNKSFKSRANLNSHRETHIDVKPYICDICGLGLKRKANLKDHLYAIHKIGSPPKTDKSLRKVIRFKCDKCDEKFETQQYLTAHEEQVHGEVTRFPCDICGQDYISLRVMKQHKKTHDPNAVTYCCGQCGKSCARKVDLKNHMLLHGEKNLACPFCNKRFHTKNNMREHLMIHTGVFPYKCSLCSKGFSATSKLKKHLKKHNKDVQRLSWNNVELNYQCGFCLVCFPDDTEVKAHSKVCLAAKKWDEPLKEPTGVNYLG